MAKAKKNKVMKQKTNEPSREVASILASIRKEFKDDSIVTVGSKLKEFDLEGIMRIPTGSAMLDIELGGGIPIGRVTHISGEFSSTKTTQSLHIIRNAQKMGLLCAYMDFEGTTDVAYLKQLEVDDENLIYCKPTSLEEVTQLMQSLQEKGVKLIVWDSVASSEPTKVLESETGESVQMGVKQKLIGEYLAKFQSINNGFTRKGEMPCTLIAINQVREKIGAYGDPEYEPGGRALGFYQSVLIRLRKGDWIIEGKGNDKEIVGQVVKFKVVKNKTYKRMRSGEFDFYYEDGNNAEIKGGFNDNFKSTITLAILYGLIERGGAWFYLYPGTDKEMKFQGLEKTIDYLREHPDIVEEYKQQILELDRKGV